MFSGTHTRLGIFLAIVFIGVMAAWYTSADYVVDRFSHTEPDFFDTSLYATSSMTLIGPASTTKAYLPPIPEPVMNGRIQWGAYWNPMTLQELRTYGTLEREPGPPRVGVQVGHWQLEDVPEELEGLKDSTGARGSGHTEQATVLAIARLVQKNLEKEGVVVDLIPATVPVDYVADAFVSVHADGSSDTRVSGFKIAGPRTDFSRKADDLRDAIYDSYEKATGLRRDENNITRRMSGYYAFNWRRYDHAVHPLTPAVIVETGFMTSAADRRIIVSQPERAARGISEGIMAFLEAEGLMGSTTHTGE